MRLAHFLAIFFLAFFAFSLAKKRKSKADQAEPRFGGENVHKFQSGKCAFFCFFVPFQDELINMDFHGDLSCSDIVYGFAEVQDEGLKLATEHDLIPDAYYGNFRLITALQQIRHGPKILLGMKKDPKARFLDEDAPQGLARNVSRRMVFYARRYGFSGIFLKFDSKHLLSAGFEQFVEELSEENARDAKELGRPKLSLVLAISSHWARYVWRKMAFLDTHFDTFYLWADETQEHASETHPPEHAVPVDPLYASQGRVPRREGFAESAERLAATGVSRQKIVVGLSAWTRSYELATTVNVEREAEEGQAEGTDDAEEQQHHDEDAALPRVSEFGVHGPETHQHDGRLSLQEFCKMHAKGMQGLQRRMDYDNASETLTLVDGHHWYSGNLPEHDSFVNKLLWVRDHEFGGVGLFSMQADDPRANCTHRRFPLHQSVAANFKCMRSGHRGYHDEAEGQSPCTRLCLVDFDRDVSGQMDFAKLGPGWCSHLVLSSVIVNPFMSAVPSKGLNKALKLYNGWEAEGTKPFLVISFVGNAEQWRLATLGGARFILIESIRRLIDQANADGVDINCANGGPDSEAHLEHFAKFLQDLRKQLPRKTVFLTLAPSSFIEEQHFNFGTLEKSVDFFVAIGYRFHRHNNPHTGHHSPLFGSHNLLNQPRLTIEGMTQELLHHQVPPEKVIVALSAEAMSMHFAEDLLAADGEEHAQHEPRAWDSYQIGEPASMAFIHGTRSGRLPHGALSQTEVCEILKKEHVHSRFLSDLAVPYLVNNQNEFIAYDNKRSIQIKTVWLSLQGLAGIALHGVELDNVDAKCPQGEAFPILRTIVETQTCTKCNASGAESSQSTTSSSSSTTPSPPANADAKNEVAASTSTSKPPLTLNCPIQRRQFMLHCALNMSSKIAPETLPLDACDAVVLFDDGITLDAQGRVNVTDNVAKQMAELVKTVPSADGKQVWAELNCSMSSAQWAQALKENRPKLVSGLATFVAFHNLTGVVLNCDHLQSAEVREEFGKMLAEFRTHQMAKGKNHEKDKEDKSSKSKDNKSSEEEKHKKDKEEDEEEDMPCPMAPGIALRLPLSRTNLSRVYDVQALNRHAGAVFLQAGTTFSKHHKQTARLVNPLFTAGIAHRAGHSYTQNATLSGWLADSLDRRLVVMELPANGLFQKGDAEQRSEPTRIGRAEVCAMQQKRGVEAKTQYDAVVAYWYTRDEWVSAESADTARYKLHFALAHRLGGAALRALDEDDPRDACKLGAFPLLQTLHAARCKPKVHSLVERDSTFVSGMNRG